MRGCHLPLLYIGLEYSLTNNQQYAERFFSQVWILGGTIFKVCLIPFQALEIAPHDPFVLHELGVTAFQSGQYEVAEKYLRDALLKVEAVSKGGGEEMVWSLHSLKLFQRVSFPRWARAWLTNGRACSATWATLTGSLEGFHPTVMLLMIVIDSSTCQVWGGFVLSPASSGPEAPKPFYLLCYWICSGDIISLVGTNRQLVPENVTIHLDYSRQEM